MTISQRLAHSATLLRDRPRHLQILLAIILPAIAGAVAGIILGVNAIAYLVLGLVFGIAQFISGYEHRDGWGGADRGFAGGAVYGTALLLMHAAVGTHAKVSLGSFPPLMIVLTALIGMILGASGGRLARIERDRVARIERDRLRDEQRALGRIGAVTVNQPVDG